jgi:hypothetical protein
VPPRSEQLRAPRPEALDVPQLHLLVPAHVVGQPRDLQHTLDGDLRQPFHARAHRLLVLPDEGPLHRAHVRQPEDVERGVPQSTGGP